MGIFGWKGNQVGCYSSNIYLNVIVTKKVSFVFPSFWELGNFTSSFDGEIPLRQESIDSLWTACWVPEQLNWGGRDAAPKLL